MYLMLQTFFFCVYCIMVFGYMPVCIDILAILEMFSQATGSILIRGVTWCLMSCSGHSADRQAQ